MLPAVSRKTTFYQQATTTKPLVASPREVKKVPELRGNYSAKLATLPCFRPPAPQKKGLSCWTAPSFMVPMAGLEPAQLSPLPPQDSVSTNSTTSANSVGNRKITLPAASRAPSLRRQVQAYRCRRSPVLLSRVPADQVPNRRLVWHQVWSALFPRREHAR